MVKRASWLSVTPEPERELPAAVATLRGAGAAIRAATGATNGATSAATTGDAVAEEAARIERLVLQGTQRSWHQYLHEVVELIERRSGDSDPDVARAREVAIAVIANHHNLLLALPGRAGRQTETDRRRLSELLATRNEEQE
jgi:hypothetical protein